MLLRRRFGRFRRGVRRDRVRDVRYQFLRGFRRICRDHDLFRHSGRPCRRCRRFFGLWRGGAFRFFVAAGFFVVLGAAVGFGVAVGSGVNVGSGLGASVGSGVGDGGAVGDGVGSDTVRTTRCGSGVGSASVNCTVIFPCSTDLRSPPRPSSLSAEALLRRRSPRFGSCMSFSGSYRMYLWMSSSVNSPFSRSVT